jgi:hypothetical protein
MRVDAFQSTFFKKKKFPLIYVVPIDVRQNEFGNLHHDNLLYNISRSFTLTLRVYLRLKGNFLINPVKSSGYYMYHQV